MPTRLTMEIIAAAILGFEEQKRHIDIQIVELRAALSGSTAAPRRQPRKLPKGKRRKMSAAGRKRIGDAQRKRWVESKGRSESPSETVAAKPKRKMSAAGRKAISEATKKDGWVGSVPCGEGKGEASHRRKEECCQKGGGEKGDDEGSGGTSQGPSQQPAKSFPPLAPNKPAEQDITLSRFAGTASKHRDQATLPDALDSMGNASALARCDHWVGLRTRVDEPVSWEQKRA